MPDQSGEAVSRYSRVTPGVPAGLKKAMAASILLPDSMGIGGREPLLLLLAAFLVTFVLTRVYTRLARLRGWGSGSVGQIHLHHMAIGILLILLSGLLVIAVQPTDLALDFIAIVFGIGGAFTLDEFALWLYLRDVYWCPEGRSSIDATVTGVLLAALLLVGTSPFGVGEGSQGAPRTIAFGMVAANICFAIVALLKGKLTLGLVSVFLPLVGLFGAVRLAKPRSLWAKWFYRERKLERTCARYAPTSRLRRFHDRLDDLIGGAPSIGIMMPPLGR